MPFVPDKPARGRFVPDAPAQTAKPEIRRPSLGEIAEKGPIRAMRETFMQDPTPRGAYRIANMPS